MKCCVSTYIGTWTNWLTFESYPDYSPYAGTGLLSPLLHKPSYVEFYVGKFDKDVLVAAARHGFTADRCEGFIHRGSEPWKHLRRRYMRSTESPSTVVFSFFLSPMGQHMLPLHASAGASLTSCPNVQAQQWDKCSVTRHRLIGQPNGVCSVVVAWPPSFRERCVWGLREGSGVERLCAMIFTLLGL